MVSFQKQLSAASHLRKRKRIVGVKILTGRAGLMATRKNKKKIRVVVIEVFRGIATVHECPEDVTVIINDKAQMEV